MIDHLLAVASMTWVPWVPGYPLIFKQWVPEPINFGKKKLNHIPFSVRNKSPENRESRL